MRDMNVRVGDVQIGRAVGKRSGDRTQIKSEPCGHVQQGGYSW